MSISAVVAVTPHYVLLDENRRIGPKVVPSPSGIECSAIYGFSGKSTYDKFCVNARLALKPYPLVKLFLRSQVDAAHDALKLVVLDAAGPREPFLHAATMEAVLEAQENRATQVIAAYRLLFDQETDAYWVEEDSA